MGFTNCCAASVDTALYLSQTKPSYLRPRDSTGFCQPQSGKMTSMMLSVPETTFASLNSRDLTPSQEYRCWQDVCIIVRNASCPLHACVAAASRRLSAGGEW